MLKDVVMRLDCLTRVLDTDGVMAEYMLSDLLTPLITPETQVPLHSCQGTMTLFFSIPKLTLMKDRYDQVQVLMWAGQS